MWELHSHIQILPDQLNLINLDLYVPWGLCELNPNEKSQHILCAGHSMNWNSQVDYGTTD